MSKGSDWEWERRLVHKTRELVASMKRKPSEVTEEARRELKQEAAQRGLSKDDLPVFLR